MAEFVEEPITAFCRLARLDLGVSADKHNKNGGTQMQVSPNVRAVQVPDENPMHPQFTTIYLVGNGQVLTIDSGEDFERYRWMLRGYLAATEKAEISLSAVTHHHSDHSSNLRWLRDEFGAAIHVLREGVDLLGERLPDSGVSHTEDGSQIEISGGLQVQVLHTPGHSADSVCFYLESEGVLFTGDTILGASTTTISDLSAYLATLERIRSLPNLRVICPGHGPVIDEPLAVIDDYVRRRVNRESEILDVLATGAEFTSWSLVELLYTHVDKRLWRAADRVMRSHLEKLAKEGRLTVYDGIKKETPPGDLVEAQEEEHARIEILRKADEIRAQDKRRLVGLQEAGPRLEWDEPPRYELNR